MQALTIPLILITLFKTLNRIFTWPISICLSIRILLLLTCILNWKILGYLPIVISGSIAQILPNTFSKAYWNLRAKNSNQIPYFRNRQVIMITWLFISPTVGIIFLLK